VQALWFIALVGVLVAVHELGHFVVARMCDVRVLRLSLGFGPRLLALRWGDTEYVLAAVPLGGYVRLLGENPGDVIAPAERHRAFPAKPAWQRLAIVLAGPLANLALPTLLYFQVYAGETTTLGSTVGTVFPGQPAAGVLQPGDHIVAIDDTPVGTWDEVARLVSAAPGRDLRITYERGSDRPTTKVITPRAHPRLDAFGERELVGQLGVTPRVRLSQIGIGGSAAFRPADSPAARAGLRTFDVITSVQGRPVETWHELEQALATGRGEAVLVTYLRPTDPTAALLPVTRLSPGTAQIFPEPSAAAAPGAGRFDTGLRPAERFVATIEAGSPAERIGLRPGDEIDSVDGEAVGSWEVLAQRLEEHPERRVEIGWRTPAGERRSAACDLLAGRTGRGDEPPSPSLGAEPSRAVKPMREIAIDGRLPHALGRAVATTASVSVAMVQVFGRLLLGRLPPTAIGGPIMIYHLTGVAVARGPEQLLSILALLSINLALLNLLPVPILDGGYLLFFGLTAALGRPLSERQRERLNYAGLAVLLGITLLAARNDVVRYWLAA